MTNSEARSLAVKHNAAKGNSSSAFSIENGDRLIVGGKPELALRWYVNSMAHSVGVFHADYERAASLYGATFTSVGA